MKKKLAIILAVCLIFILAVGTTLSYFTDSDGATNTMTVGKVDIDQIETAATTGLKLLPVTAAPGTDGLIPANKNAIDMTVSVKLVDGSEEAYVRTLVAFQLVGGADPVATGEIVPVWSDNVRRESVKVNGNPLTFEKDGNQYVVYEYIYANQLIATNKTTEASLKQVYMASKVDNTFHGKLGNSGSYNILVLSQGVQAQGFGSAAEALNAAFPYDTNTIAGWFTNVAATN